EQGRLRTGIPPGHEGRRSAPQTRGRRMDLHHLPDLTAGGGTGHPVGPGPRGRPRPRRRTTLPPPDLRRQPRERGPPMSERTRVGELRTNQLLHTFGVGSLIDLPNVSVVVRGLDAWRTSYAAPLQENRLLA